MFRLFASPWNMCSPCLLRSSIVIKFQRNVAALEMKRFVIRSDILSNVHLRDRNAKQSHRKITEEQHSFLRRKCNQNFDGFYRKGLFGLNSYTQNAVSIAIVLITRAKIR